MADDVESDDQWLYGDTPELPTDEALDPFADPTSSEPSAEDVPKSTNNEVPPSEASNEEQLESPPHQEEQEQEEQPPEHDNFEDAPQQLSSEKSTHEQLDDLRPPGVDPDEDDDPNKDATTAGGGGEKQNGDASEGEDSDDDSDDDVNVVIGDIKTSPAYINIKRGGLLTSTATDKNKQPIVQPGKFSVEEFDQMGMINGVPAADYNLDSLEDKPWRKPGADITDYFNYGFNEDTWKAYCERQKRIRVNESGVGLVPLNPIGLPRGPIPVLNDTRLMPPGSKMDTPKENIIQVMTADRREYSRKPPGFPDLSMPPPSAFGEFQPEFGFNPEPEPFYGGYEPTQDVQWGTGGASWAPNEIKQLTPGPPGGASMGPPLSGALLHSRDGTPPLRRGSRDRDRDREISRSRSEKPRDRDRERSHRRERSRSRSRRHKSRSRSPSHRHRKKKSRRHEESD